MKKLLLTLSLFAGTFLYSFSQTKTTNGPKISLGVDVGLPTGAAQDVYSVVYGASVKAEFPIAASSFNFTVTAGFSSFSVKGMYSPYLTNANYIPIEVGGRIYANSVIFLEGNIGASISANSNYTGPNTALIYAPAIGIISSPNSNNGQLDLSLRYEGRVEPGGTISQIALRLAYRF